MTTPLKLASWNVNGLRACMKKGFMDFLAADYDIVALQETKMQESQSDFTFDGYHTYWNDAEKKGYSGTLVLTKTAPISIKRGMGIAEHDREGRILTLEYSNFFLVNVYTPNSKRELLRLPYRMTWEDAFRSYLLSAGKPVIVCGDLNVAHREIDIARPKSNTKNAGFTPEEREKMTKLLESGFVDTYRHLNPEKAGAYTWWSYMGASREKNIGWRIDYFLTSTCLAPNILAADILADVHGSDHCPITLEIALETDATCKK